MRCRENRLESEDGVPLSAPRFGASVAADALSIVPLGPLRQYGELVHTFCEAEPKHRVQRHQLVRPMRSVPGSVAKRQVLGKGRKRLLIRHLDRERYSYWPPTARRQRFSSSSKTSSVGSAVPAPADLLDDHLVAVSTQGSWDPPAARRTACASRRSSTYSPRRDRPAPSLGSSTTWARCEVELLVMLGTDPLGGVYRAA